MSLPSESAQVNERTTLQVRTRTPSAKRSIDLVVEPLPVPRPEAQRRLQHLMHPPERCPELLHRRLVPGGHAPPDPHDVPTQALPLSGIRAGSTTGARPARPGPERSGRSPRGAGPPLRSALPRWYAYAYGMRLRTSAAGGRRARSTLCDSICMTTATLFSEGDVPPQRCEADYFCRPPSEVSADDIPLPCSSSHP